MDIPTIIGSVVTVTLGVTFIWTKLSKVIETIQQTAELLAKVSEALGDQKLTAEEISQIKKEAMDIAAVWKK